MLKVNDNTYAHVAEQELQSRNIMLSPCTITRQLN